MYYFFLNTVYRILTGSDTLPDKRTQPSPCPEYILTSTDFGTQYGEATGDRLLPAFGLVLRILVSTTKLCQHSPCGAMTEVEAFPES